MQFPVKIRKTEIGLIKTKNPTKFHSTHNIRKFDKLENSNQLIFV